MHQSSSDRGAIREDTQDMKRSKHFFRSFQLTRKAGWSVSPQQRKSKAPQFPLVSLLEACCINNAWCSLYWCCVSISYDLVGWAQASASHEHCDKCLPVPQGKMSPTCVSFTCLETTIPVPWGGSRRQMERNTPALWLWPPGMVFLSLLSKSRFLFLFLDLVKTSVIGLSLLDV